MYKKIKFGFILSLLAIASGCIASHNYKPAIGDLLSKPSRCITSARFQTLLSGLPPDITTEGQNRDLKVSSDPANDKSSPILDRMATQVFTESGILSSSSSEGINIRDGLFFQINNHIDVDNLGYAWTLFSYMTLTIIPGHSNTQELFDISVFDNGKFLFHKKYVHKIDTWHWLPLVFFGFPDSKAGEKYYKNILRESIAAVVEAKTANKTCSN